MTMTDPLVSVLIPAYNAEGRVSEAILSVLQQSFEDYEVIVLDDASDDNTYDVVSSFDDRRVTVVQNEENLGISRSRNKLISYASGDYVAWLDSDDRMVEDRLERQVAFFYDHAEHALVGGAIRIIDEDGEPIGKRTYPTTHEDIHDALLRYNPFAQPAVMTRRVVLEDADGFREDIDIGEDYDLMLRVAADHRVANLDAVLTEYRVFDEQTTTANMKQTMQNTVSIQQRAINEYGYEDDWVSWLHRIGLTGALILPRPVIQWLFSTVFIDDTS